MVSDFPRAALHCCVISPHTCKFWNVVLQQIGIVFYGTNLVNKINITSVEWFTEFKKITEFERILKVLIRKHTESISGWYIISIKYWFYNDENVHS